MCGAFCSTGVDSLTRQNERNGFGEATAHVAAVCLCLMATTGLSRAGILRVHSENPRYFTDGSSRAIYLGGHQIFVDLQDNSFNKAFIRGRKRILDWNQYLDFVEAHHLNYLRNWVIWSTGSGRMAPVNKAIAYPMPYKRVEGHGRANDGGDKFDVHQFDEAFFQRLRKRCENLQKRGVYISIMLFEVYGFLGGEACGDPVQTLWDGNVFNKANNVNGIHVDYDGDGRGVEFFYTDDEVIHKLQQKYVRKVIETVNHLDNVIYEIANELYAPQWQREMIRYIKGYEKTKPKQHLVLMSPGGRLPGGRGKHGAWKQMPKDVVVGSGADCFAVAGGWDSGRYREKNPPVDHSGKPAFVDMDHVAPGSDEVGFAWSAFTRGYHYNLYDKPFESPDSEGRSWECVRHNVGKTVEYARRIDLVHMSPRDDLSSTTFCLAKPGCEYIVYEPGSSSFTVSALEPGGQYHYEWYDTQRHRVTETGQAKASGPAMQFSPANRGMVLYLKRATGTK